MENIRYGDTDEFDALAFGEMHPSTMQFIENINASQPSQALGQAAQQFLSHSQDIYENFMDSQAQAMRTIRAAGRHIRHRWDNNVIQPLEDVGAIQQAPPVMQRYIMAEPTIRSWYHDQRLDGYSESYVDSFPRVVGEEHYDYRRVMNGVVCVDDDGWSVTEYAETLLEGDRELYSGEQVDVLSTWDRAVTQLFEGEDDPTSPWNSEL